MKRSVLLALSVGVAGAVVAQSNAVPGLDGRLTRVDNLTYYGRRGPAHPNGEIGMAMLNEMCNPGTVNIPWYAAMQSNHPKFGFLLVRLHDDRLEQISDWSYCKHAFTSTNYSGSGCGTTCQDPNTGSLMGVSCFDTYGAGNNADRTWLGPPQEIDPWLGTWNPVGSYFDVGDPQTGLGAADGVRSLNTSGFDSVKNRMTVREVDLTTAGAQYFYGIHLIHQGEAVANRWDNLASRGVSPSYSGGTWSFPNNSVGQAHGSILQRWPGASIDAGQNGNDDGRIFVAVKVTPLGGGMYHYEYAVHNVDNHRGAASFRVPVDPAATVANFTFGDIDQNPLNDWLGAKVGSEIVFSATPNNPLNWNTIYNFGFDCSVPPSGGFATLDAARMGPGQLWVDVGTQVPSGVVTAQVATIGSSAGCGSCDAAVYETFAASGFDLDGRSLSLTYQAGGYRATSGSLAFVPAAGTTLSLGDDTQTTVTLPFVLPYPGGSTNQLRVCSNGFVSAGDNGTAYVPNVGDLLNGLPRWTAYWRDLNPGTGGQVRFDAQATVARLTWDSVYTYGTTTPNTFQVTFHSSGNVDFVWSATDRTSSSQVLVGWSNGGGANDPGVSDLSALPTAGVGLCTASYAGLQFQASARPVLGTSIQLVTSNIPSGAPFGSVLLSLTQSVPAQDLTQFGMPGCYGHVANGISHLFVLPGSSQAMNFAVPSATAFTGLVVFGQSFVFAPGLTPVGAIASNGLALLLGP